jgi:hypothetical protein
VSLQDLFIASALPFVIVFATGEYIFHNSALPIATPTKLLEIQNCSFSAFVMIFLKPFDFIR